MNDQTREFDDIKARINELVAERKELFDACREYREKLDRTEKENRELRADRDFLRQAMDQIGGKG